MPSLPVDQLKIECPIRWALLSLKDQRYRRRDPNFLARYFHLIFVLDCQPVERTSGVNLPYSHLQDVHDLKIRITKIILTIIIAISSLLFLFIIQKTRMPRKGSHPLKRCQTEKWSTVKGIKLSTPRRSNIMRLTI